MDTRKSLQSCNNERNGMHNLNFPLKINPNPDDFAGEFYQIFEKEIMPIVH